MKFPSFLPALLSTALLLAPAAVRANVPADEVSSSGLTRDILREINRARTDPALMRRTWKRCGPCTGPTASWNFGPARSRFAPTKGFRP